MTPVKRIEVGGDEEVDLLIDLLEARHLNEIEHLRRRRKRHRRLKKMTHRDKPR